MKRSEVHEGMRVVLVRDCSNTSGHPVKLGTEARVTRVEGPGYDGEWDVKIDTPATDGTKSMWLSSDGLEPAPLDPSKVKAGDTVTVRGPASRNRGTVDVSASITGVVLAIDSKFIRLHGVAGYHKVQDVTAHQPAPEPEPEYRSQFVQVELDGGETALGHVDEHGDFYGLSDDGYRRESSDGDFKVLSPLVVIDPAAVDVDALVKAFDFGWAKATSNYTKAGVLALLAELGIVLAELGIEAP